MERLKGRTDARGQELYRRAQDTYIAHQQRLAENSRRASPTYQQSALAAIEAEGVDKETNSLLSLMRSSGEQGGITMANGVRAAYTMPNIISRIQEIEKEARTTALSDERKRELSALMRGAASLPGGAGKMGSIIRSSADQSGNVNRNFMSAVGEVYSRDGTVRSKMNEKDMGASIYTEQFMTGGAGLVGGVGTFAAFKGTSDYIEGMNNRVKSYAAGLNQGGKAVTEYIEGLSQEDCQAIMNDPDLLNSLDVDVRQQFMDYAAGRTGTALGDDGKPKYDYSKSHTGWSVTGPTAKRVELGEREMGVLGDIRRNTEETGVWTELGAESLEDINNQLHQHNNGSGNSNK